MRVFVLFAAVFGLLVLPHSLQAGNNPFQSSGLPIPRFVSLGSDKVFVRSGPALRYPVRWVFQKKGLPVEVIQEFDTWRKIRDAEGEEGWIHQSLLSGRRSVLVRAEGLVSLHKRAGEGSTLLAKLEPDVVAELQGCRPGWCDISAEGYRGWVQRQFLWGVYAREE